MGRSRELSLLQARLAQAQLGQRQLVFVSGEVGMGKTTLVEAFISTLTQDSSIRIGRGYCTEHTGPVEAYLPILDALGSLSRGRFGRELAQVLRRVAPTWLLQLPMLVLQAEGEASHLEASASTRDRMIRELVDALGVLSTDHLVVLVLEDLHWSDPSTIDWLGAMMRRPEAARLLIVGTYRPLETQVRNYPLLQGQAISLRPLSPEALHTFVENRLSGSIDEELAAMLFDRSDGNPLFLCRLVDYLLHQELVIEHQGQWQLRDGGLADHALPNGVRQLLTINSPSRCKKYSRWRVWRGCK